jgi:putative DNA methylase
MAYRKKLIEVALPLAAISEASASEKDIHTGLPANLHTWWSRKPLAACRAIIFASLVDDPNNDSAPRTFVDACRSLPKGPNASVDDTPRQRLFDFIETLIKWENMRNNEVLEKAHSLIKLCANGYLPPLLDPFSGGGSIPLEAQRLGLEAHASDLNPVAVLINKAQLEIPPRYLNKPPVNPKDRKRLNAEVGWRGVSGLAADVRYYGELLGKWANERIGHFYPAGPNQETVIAWLWSRTVKCSNPACGAHTPLVNKFWVSTHRGNEAWVEPRVNTANKSVEYTIRNGKGSPREGTVSRSGATCLVCGSPIPFDYIRQEGRQGRIKYQLMTIVVDTPGGRKYLPPNQIHADLANQVEPTWVPGTQLPEKALGFRVQNYGITRHEDLFTARQLAALSTFAELISPVREQIVADSDGDIEYANALVTFLALAVDRLMQTNNTLVRWLIRKTGTSKGTPAFDRPIVSMLWEFAEGNVFGRSVGSWTAALENCLTAFKSFPEKAIQGNAIQQDAASQFNVPRAPIISTDPPYFDNIGYADLSDFYYIWLRKALRNIYPDIFGTLLVPKERELIAARHLFDGDQTLAEQHFTDGLKQAFTALCRQVNEDYPVTVYYAFKQAENGTDEDSQNEAVASTGWETMLEALLQGGFCINGTWPMRTEQRSRLRAIGSNALASSIVLVCRPRAEDAPTISRRQFVDALRRELPAALKEMQSGNIAPVDLAQASIGPGMAIYSRYSKVLEADGSPMSVRTALGLINQELDAYLAEQDGDIDADTRFAVSWFEQFGFNEGEFGQADVLARAKNTSVAGVEAAGLVLSGRGKVRLLHWKEYDLSSWDPQQDKRPTVWEATHHLIKRLNSHGETGSAMLMTKMPPDMAAEARNLAYRLYSICERKGWADHARDYNALVISWAGIGEETARLRDAEASGDATTQMSMFGDEE